MGKPGEGSEQEHQKEKKARKRTVNKVLLVGTAGDTGVDREAGRH